MSSEKRPFLQTAKFKERSRKEKENAREEESRRPDHKAAKQKALRREIVELLLSYHFQYFTGTYVRFVSEMSPEELKRVQKNLELIGKWSPWRETEEVGKLVHQHPNVIELVDRFMASQFGEVPVHRLKRLLISIFKGIAMELHTQPYLLLRVPPRRPSPLSSLSSTSSLSRNVSETALGKTSSHSSKKNRPDEFQVASDAEASVRAQMERVIVHVIKKQLKNYTKSSDVLTTEEQAYHQCMADLSMNDLFIGTATPMPQQQQYYQRRHSEHMTGLAGGTLVNRGLPASLTPFTSYLATPMPCRSNTNLASSRVNTLVQTPVTPTLFRPQQPKPTLPFSTVSKAESPSLSAFPLPNRQNVYRSHADYMPHTRTINTENDNNSSPTVQRGPTDLKKKQQESLDRSDNESSQSEEEHEEEEEEEEEEAEPVDDSDHGERSETEGAEIWENDLIVWSDEDENDHAEKDRQTRRSQSRSHVTSPQRTPLKRTNTSTRSDSQDSDDERNLDETDKKQSIGQTEKKLESDEEDDVSGEDYALTLRSRRTRGEQEEEQQEEERENDNAAREKANEANGENEHKIQRREDIKDDKMVTGEDMYSNKDISANQKDISENQKDTGAIREDTRLRKEDPVAGGYSGPRQSEVDHLTSKGTGGQSATEDLKVKASQPALLSGDGVDRFSEEKRAVGSFEPTKAGANNQGASAKILPQSVAELHLSHAPSRDADGAAASVVALKAKMKIMRESPYSPFLPFSGSAGPGGEGSNESSSGQNGAAGGRNKSGSALSGSGVAGSGVAGSAGAGAGTISTGQKKRGYWITDLMPKGPVADQPEVAMGTPRKKGAGKAGESLDVFLEENWLFRKGQPAKLIPHQGGKKPAAQQESLSSNGEFVQSLYLDRYPIQKMKRDATVGIIGKRRQGKSELMKEIGRQLQFARAVALCGSLGARQGFLEWMMPRFVFKGSKHKLSEVVREHSRWVEQYPGAPLSAFETAFFIDDMAFSPEFMRSEELKELAMNGRQLGLFVCISIQYLMEANPALRGNFDVVIVTKEVSRANREKLYKQYGGSLPTLAHFERVLEACTKDYGVLVIDCTASEVDITRNMFHYRANPFLPRWILGIDNPPDTGEEAALEHQSSENTTNNTDWENPNQTTEQLPQLDLQTVIKKSAVLTPIEEGTDAP